jgi:hypothetical protein
MPARQILKHQFTAARIMVKTLCFKTEVLRSLLKMFFQIEVSRLKSFTQSSDLKNLMLVMKRVILNIVCLCLRFFVKGDTPVFLKFMFIIFLKLKLMI